MNYQNKSLFNKHINSCKIKKAKNIDIDIKNLDDNKTLYSYNYIQKQNNYFNRKSNYNYRKIKNIYYKTGEIIDNIINNNMNKMKKKEEFKNLKKILSNLKSQNQKIKKELTIIQNKNCKLDNYKNKYIYQDIKNIFNNNKNIIKKDKQMNIEDLLNFYKFKFGTPTTFEEKIKILRNIYIYENLKNSLVDNTNILFMNNKISNGNSKEESLLNINNTLKWIISLIDDIEKIKKINKEIEEKIKNKKDENNKYNFYYNNWLNLLGIKTKEELYTKIKDLILDQNYNDINEKKLYNILMIKNH